MIQIKKLYLIFNQVSQPVLFHLIQISRYISRQVSFLIQMASF